MEFAAAGEAAAHSIRRGVSVRSCTCFPRCPTGFCTCFLGLSRIFKKNKPPRPRFPVFRPGVQVLSRCTTHFREAPNCILRDCIFHTFTCFPWRFMCFCCICLHVWRLRVSLPYVFTYVYAYINIPSHYMYTCFHTFTHI